MAGHESLTSVHKSTAASVARDSSRRLLHYVLIFDESTQLDNAILSRGTDRKIGRAKGKITAIGKIKSGDKVTEVKTTDYFVSWSVAIADSAVHLALEEDSDYDELF